MDNIGKDIAQKLLQINAIKLSPHSPYTWASGMKSPIYCDNRLSLSYPEVRTIIIDGFVAMAKNYENIDVIGGVATAGIPHGAILAEKLQKPFMYVRNKAKEHGRKNQIEGHLPKGSRVLLIEDLISTGMSSLRAVEGIRNAECQVISVGSIFNYGFQKAIDAFLAKKCTFASLCNYDILIQEAVKIGYVKEADIELLSKWRSDPDNWI